MELRALQMTELVYSPPMEEEECIPSLAWDKDTIKYVTEHRNKVMKTIRGSAKSMSSFNTMDIEDIYSHVIEYLYKSDDYDVQQGLEKSNSGNLVTLEGYVNSCIKFCVKRYITDAYRREKDITRDGIVDDEGREKELIDIIPDNKAHIEFDDIGYDAEETLKNLECIRYKYGVDIFMVLYVRMLTIGESENKYRSVLEVLGVSKKELGELEKRTANDEDVIQAIKALSLCNSDIAMKLLEKTVYNAKRIAETVASLK